MVVAAQPLYVTPKPQTPAQPAASPAMGAIANPSGPPALQASSLAGIQNKADLMKGYGETTAEASPPQGIGQGRR